MAELITLARPYAKAAFEYARTHNTVGVWSKSLLFLENIIQQPKVQEFLDSPTITVEQKTTVLFNLHSEEFDDKIKCFIIIIAENKRLAILKQVRQLFEDFRSDQEKNIYIKVSSAFKIKSVVEKKLVKKISHTLGKDVALSVKIDKSLIGGIVLRAGDIVIDGSIRGFLANLTKSIVT